YLKMGDIMDPWNHVYQYIPQSTTGEGTFTIISLGQDGVAGGEGENADITNEST
ncbi:MAG: type II secretion system protein GspG, partial [Sedimentisphaerales bacterium]|nr:type II secretion system protein GspG [Sedimentisphaerales bacterium]